MEKNSHTNTHQTTLGWQSSFLIFSHLWQGTRTSASATLYQGLAPMHLGCVRSMWFASDSTEVILVKGITLGVTLLYLKVKRLGYEFKTDSVVSDTLRPSQKGAHLSCENQRRYLWLNSRLYRFIKLFLKYSSLQDLGLRILSLLCGPDLVHF